MLPDDNDATLPVVTGSVHFLCPHCGRNATETVGEIQIADDNDGNFRLIVNCPICMGTVELQRD